MFTFDDNGAGGYDVHLDGRPLGHLVKTHAGSWVGVDVSDRTHGPLRGREAVAMLMLGESREAAEARQREQDADWEDYARSKSDPYAEAWGLC